MCVYVCVWRNKKLKAREFKFCIPKTAVYKTLDAWRDNCFLLKGQTQKMHLEFLIITSSAWGKYELPMNTDSKLFHAGPSHDWNRFSPPNSLFMVNYKGYWNYGRCQDCHYIFLSHPELHCMRMINECLLTAVYAGKKAVGWGGYPGIRKYVMDTLS